MIADAAPTVDHWSLLDPPVPPSIEYPGMAFHELHAPEACDTEDGIRARLRGFTADAGEGSPVFEVVVRDGFLAVVMREVVSAYLLYLPGEGAVWCPAGIGWRMP